MRTTWDWRRTGGWCALLVAVALVAGACGSDDPVDEVDETTTTTTSTEAEAEETTAADGESTTTAEETTTTTSGGAEEPTGATCTKFAAEDLPAHVEEYKCAVDSAANNGEEDDGGVNVFFAPPHVCGADAFPPAYSLSEIMVTVDIAIRDDLITALMADDLSYELLEREPAVDIETYVVEVPGFWDSFDPANGSPLEYALNDRLDLSVETLRQTPIQLFGWHPLHRGHPVDLIEPRDQMPAEGASAGSGSQVVAVVDTSETDHPNDGRMAPEIRGHGEFIRDVIAEAGNATVHLTGIEPTGQNLGFTIFDEADVIRAIESAAASHAVDVYNFSFGAFGCDAAWPVELGLTLERTLGSGAAAYASAGNDETDQLVFPAAFGSAARFFPPRNGEQNGEEPVEAITVDIANSLTSVGSHGPDTLGGMPLRSCFSNYGDWVEMWALGEEVETGSFTWSGTSFATPIALSDSTRVVDEVAPLRNDELMEVTGQRTKRQLQTWCGPDTGYGPR